ncbi:MAG: hypothetical protein V3U25_03260 [Nitrososphaerales archaeon]
MTLKKRREVDRVKKIEYKLEILKIRCPKCANPADVDDNWDFVKCQKCGLSVSYAEFVRLQSENPEYSDILSDYKE